MHEVLVNCLFKLAQEKVWLGELTPAMTIDVDLGRKATKPIQKESHIKLKISNFIFFKISTGGLFKTVNG